jgi:H/ACA ribonucleoprotein complex subunit 4
MSEELNSLLECSFVIIDKPKGPSSHEVCSWVKKILGVKKTGHSGTLDPNVSGVLPIGISKATRLLQYLTKSDKKYVCLVKFSKALNREEILSIFKHFTGEIIQTPPKESAVRKVPRKRKIYYINPIEIKSKKVLFEVHCEAGTYIRALVSDFAKFTPAKMLDLRRIAVGKIEEKDCCTLQSLSDAMWLASEKSDESEIKKLLIPATEALDLPRVYLHDAAAKAVCNGSPLFEPGISFFEGDLLDGTRVALMTEKNELIGVGIVSFKNQSMKNIVIYPKTIIKKV